MPRSSIGGLTGSLYLFLLDHGSGSVVHLAGNLLDLLLRSLLRILLVQVCDVHVPVVTFLIIARRVPGMAPLAPRRRWRLLRVLLDC
jgi:hypothetical protein